MYFLYTQLNLFVFVWSKGHKINLEMITQVDFHPTYVIIIFINNAYK